MKTLFTALVAIAITSSASANHSHNATCPNGCTAKIEAVSAPASGMSQKANDLKNAAENKSGLIHYNQTMQSALSQVEMQKHFDALENIAGENAYHNLMATVMNTLENEKLDSQLDDLAAAQRFENLMLSSLKNIAVN